MFTIMQRLPAEGGNYQYRIKSADEPFDRVVKESELGAAGGRQPLPRWGRLRRRPNGPAPDAFPLARGRARDTRAWN